MKTKVINEEFYQAFYDLSVKAFELIRKPDRQKLIRRKFVIIDSDNLKWKWIEVEDYERLIIAKSMEIYNLEEFKKCDSIITSSSILLSNYNRHIHNIGRILFERKTLLYIIAKLAEQSQGKKISKSHYNELYLNFERLIYSNSIVVIYLIPLTSFVSEHDIIISNDLSIRKMTNSEREEWGSLVILPDISPTVLSTTYAIEYRRKVSKDIGTQESKDEDKKIIDKMNNLISSLRLLKNGYFDDYCLIKQIGFNIPHKILSYQSQSYTDFSLQEKYMLYRSDRKMLIQNYNLICKLKECRIKQKLFNNALQWLGTYSKERNHIKKLIYLAIVLETLLSDSPNAITHKLCCRTANILSSQFDEKKKIYENINDFYKARSQLLHGKSTHLFDDIGTTDMYVRKMVSEVIRRISKFDKQKSFDDQYNNFLRQIDFGDLD